MSRFGNRYLHYDLHSAAANGRIDLVLEILTTRDTNVNLQDQNGITPLHLAASQGHKNIVEILSRQNPGLNLQDQNGISALHLAAAYGHGDILKMLIARGADVGIKDNNGYSPSRIAFERGQENTLQFLLNNYDKDGFTPLHRAVLSNDLEEANFLIYSGANYNSPARTTLETPLHLAASSSNFAMVNFLLSYQNINIDAINSLGCTALHMAASANNLDVTKTLIEVGANTGIIDQFGKSPLDYLSDKNKQEIWGLLPYQENSFTEEQDYPVFRAMDSLRSERSLFSKDNYEEDEEYSLPAEVTKPSHNTALPSANQETSTIPSPFFIAPPHTTENTSSVNSPSAKKVRFEKATMELSLNNIPNLQNKEYQSSAPTSSPSPQNAKTLSLNSTTAQQNSTGRKNRGCNIL